MSITLTSESKEYIQEKSITDILIDVTIIREACLEINNPTLKIIKEGGLESVKDSIKISLGTLNVHVSREFIEIFGNREEYQIDLGGFFEKILILKNVDPINKNTCNV